MNYQSLLNLREKIKDVILSYGKVGLVIDIDVYRGENSCMEVVISYPQDYQQNSEYQRTYYIVKDSDIDWFYEDMMNEITPSQ